MLPTVFALNNEKSWKSLLVKDNQLLLVNKKYNTAEEFEASFEEKGLFKKRLTIEMADIIEMRHAEVNPTHLDIKYGAAKDFFDFENENDLNQVISHIRTQRQLQAETNSVSAFKAISPQLIGLAFTVGIALIVYEYAAELERGAEVVISGRRALVKQLFLWLAETLGTTGTLIAGAVAAAACIFFMVKNLKQPPNEVVYKYA